MPAESESHPTRPLTLAAIRAAYPEPRCAGHAASLGQTGNYCIGGAFWLAAGGPPYCVGNFPRRDTLADVFCVAMPNLPYLKASDYAEAIIDANDAGDFERAWELLGEVLEFQG